MRDEAYTKGKYEGKIARDRDLRMKGLRVHDERTPALVHQAEVHENPFWSGADFIQAVEGYIAGYLSDEPVKERTSER